MKIAIAGFGQEGKINYQYWSNGENELTIVDERASLEDLPTEAATILGTHAFDEVSMFDLVIRTAGVAPRKLQSAKKVWSATNEFFAQCPAPIIGVTGTKGKGTTASLITSILRTAGKTVHLVGNIGVPALDELLKIQPTDIVVFELSSFQLWDLEKSPHVAVVLMIEPDHLDVHKNFDEYVAAKSNIARHQTDQDTVIFNSHNTWSCQIAEASKAKKIPFVYSNDYFLVGVTQVAPISTLGLLGAHNVDNASAAVTAAWQFTNDVAAIQEGLSAFSGLDHRLKLVREVNNVKYYDDSIATTPGSAIAAIETFTQPKVLILGGSDKGANYSSLIQKCADTKTTVVAMGANGETIAALSQQHGVKCSRIDADMASVVTTASELAQSGGVVILSPAAASFDMFANYQDRGDQFIAAVNAL